MILGAPWHGRGMPNVKKLVAIAVQTFARLFRIQCHVEHMYLEYIIRSNIYANKYDVRVLLYSEYVCNNRINL